MLTDVAVEVFCQQIYFMVYFNTVSNTTLYNHLTVIILYTIYIILYTILSHGHMFRLYIRPSSGLKEISPSTKNVYIMGSHIVYKIW